MVITHIEMNEMRVLKTANDFSYFTFYLWMGVSVKLIYVKKNQAKNEGEIIV